MLDTQVSIAAKSQQPSARPAPRGARLACSAQKEDRPQLPNMLAAAALAAAVSLGTVDAAQVRVSLPNTYNAMQTALSGTARFRLMTDRLIGRRGVWYSSILHEACAEL